MARTQTAGSGPIAGSTIIGPEIRVSGRVTGEEDLHVQGRIDGAIALTETLFVAPGGIVAAEVDALNVVVSGVVVGNVTARDCVTLHAGAKLVGDIHAPRLIIADGAAFKGNVHMGGATDEAAQARAAARARAVPASRRMAPERPGVTASRPLPARAPAARTAARPAETRPSRPAPEPAAPEEIDDEPTVIVRHAEIAADDGDGRAAPPDVARFRGVAATRTAPRAREEAPAAPAAKNKLPARARIPKPGKRRVNRR